MSKLDGKMTPRDVKFNASKKDAEIIRQIVHRAARLAYSTGARLDELECLMDVTACHANGMRLRLLDWLGADDFNFLHDFAGIRRYMDKETGKLRDHFVPRFAAPRPNRKRSRQSLREIADGLRG